MSDVIVDDVVDAGSPTVEEVVEDSELPVDNQEPLPQASPSIPIPQSEPQNEIERASQTINKIRARMYTPTSRKDIEYMLGGQVRVIAYDELDNFNTIEELLYPYMSVVILYPNGPQGDVGHWTCCFTSIGSDRLEYFDSYACFIDSKIEEYNNGDDRFHRPQPIYPRLLELILNSHYAHNMHYNEYEFQSANIATACCGLWCVVRLKSKHLNENMFRKLWLDLPVAGKVLPDFLVSYMTCKWFPEMCVSC
jgi:hypothetical protein